MNYKKILLSLIMLICMSGITLATLDGSGTSADPYRIYNCEDLQEMNDYATEINALVWEGEQWP